MKATPLALPDPILFDPEVLSDKRGFFEYFNRHRFEEAAEKPATSIQDNRSHSANNVSRGLHCQIPQSQGKLLRVVRGEVFDVAVELRRSGAAGQGMGTHLSVESKYQRWVSEEFAHGFVTFPETAEFLHKTTDYYAPTYERSLDWDNSRINIAWPAGIFPTLSAKDIHGKPFVEAEVTF